MKRLFLVLGIVSVFFIITTAWAINWVTANEKTVGWDAVTKLADGTAIPEGNVIKYKLFLANAITDPDKTNPVELATIETLEYTITLNIEGQYYPGVQALRVVDGEVVATSTISWSDDPVVCLNGETFGIRHFIGLMGVTGMHSK